MLGRVLVFLNNLIGISAMNCITADHFPKLGVGGINLGLSGIGA